MRVPLIWRPAASAGIAPARLSQPVGHVDIAPTIAAIAGETADWMQGAPLPTDAETTGRAGTTTEWIDEWDGNAATLRTFVEGGRYVVTEYGATNVYDGTEGELYDLADDPHQWRNLWDDPARAGLKSDLLAALRDNLPQGRETPLEKIASV